MCSFTGLLKKRLIIFGYFGILAFLYTLDASVDPLSKIVITSTMATCTKGDKNSGEFIFKYQENVKVTFADQSTVTADSLEIIFDSKSKHSHKNKNIHLNAKSPQSTMDSFKQILFKDHVCVVSAQRKATADMAYFFLPEERCVLEGNVKIWQVKQRKSDVPIAIESEKAELNLASGLVNFLGSTQNPVSTTIVLEGLPGLQKKKISKKKKHGKDSSSPST
jgi:lipopolysaccharide export system protein LptA